MGFKRKGRKTGLYSAGDIKKAAQYASILAELRYRLGHPIFYESIKVASKQIRIYESAIATMMDRFDEVMQLGKNGEEEERE